MSVYTASKQPEFVADKMYRLRLQVARSTATTLITTRFWQ